MGKTITLKEVARDAGVSHITVSRVLNRTTGRYPISKRTQKKVLESIDKLEYCPSAVARATRTRRTGIISLIYCRDDFSHFGNDRFYLSVQGGIEGVLGENEKSLLISSVTREQLENGRLPIAIHQGLADAILSFEISEPAFIGELIGRKLPTVLINSQLPDANMDCVIQDNIEAFKGVTERIIDWGHCSIGFVTSSQYTNAVDRREDGFRQALREWNIPFNDDYKISANPWTDEAGRLVVELKKKFPMITAFMCTTDGLAVAVVNGLREAGWKVPEDVSVIGCGGHHPWLTNEFCLTTVRFEEEQMGQMAARLILNRLNGQSLPGRVEIQEGQFIPGSTAGEVRNIKCKMQDEKCRKEVCDVR